MSRIYKPCNRELRIEDFHKFIAAVIHYNITVYATIEQYMLQYNSIRYNIKI